MRHTPLILVICISLGSASGGASTADRPAVVITNSIGMKLKLIPPGEFMMGPNVGEDARHLVHRVNIEKPFYIGVTEVTQGQWKSVMGNNPSFFQGDDSHPVENVSWEDCQAFLRKLSQTEGTEYRFPTEAEWEYACRAGSPTNFCFGDEESTLREYAWYISGSGRKTHPVRQRRANAWELYDMHGNVLEWCQDGYDDCPGEVPTSDSHGTKYRMLRGGRFNCSAGCCRSAFRSWSTPTLTINYVGLRVVRTP
jgi:formylglycine-generating enzyme required for sulfatase activity